MTPSVHPSSEQISDLLAGVLPAAEVMELNAHLSSCAGCQRERDAVLDVIVLLADEGAVPLEMPADVASSLDAALSRASAERAPSVTELASVRRSSGRQPWKWVAGAAAAFAVVSLGVAGLVALPKPDDNTTGATSAGHPAFDQGLRPGESRDYATPSAAAGTLSDQLSDLASLSPAEVAPQARRLSAATASGDAPPPYAGCAVPITGGPSTVILFKRRRAVLTVQPDIRVVTVYDCATATRPLFTTTY